jgi:hypothetical protein
MLFEEIFIIPIEARWELRGCLLLHFAADGGVTEGVLYPGPAGATFVVIHSMGRKYTLAVQPLPKSKLYNLPSYAVGPPPAYLKLVCSVEDPSQGVSPLATAKVYNCLTLTQLPC